MDDEFVNYDLEFPAWTSFVGVVKNYNESLEKELKSLHDMNIKVWFLHDHLDEFLYNYNDVSDEQEERFHQDIKTIEEREQGRSNKRMMAYFGWSIKKT